MKKNKEEEPKEEVISASDLQMEQLTKLQQEATEFKEKYFLSLAELENTRKRLQKEKQEMTKFAAESIILEFLTPIDNLENALSFTDQMSPETKNWAMGFNMLLSQFKDVLSSNGVSAFHVKGEQFDATRHEAVEAEETDSAKEGTILQEFLCGYKKADRIIRPARVKVAKKPKEETKITGEDDV
jgi:molecular chaperone GrpE